MSIPLVDSLDEALGRLFPAKVMNDLFSVENLREEMEERRGGRGLGNTEQRNGPVKKSGVELIRRDDGKGARHKGRSRGQIN